MSVREYAKMLIDNIPDGKLDLIVSFLKSEASEKEIPNKETLEAFEEIECGGGTHFSGSTEELFRELASD